MAMFNKVGGAQFALRVEHHQPHPIALTPKNLALNHVHQSSVVEAVMKLPSTTPPVPNGPPRKPDLPFIAQLKAGPTAKQHVGERVLDDLKFTVKGIQAEPDLFKRVSGYMQLHGMGWSNHMDRKTTLEWSLHTAGVPDGLHAAILSDRQNLPAGFDMNRQKPLVARVVKSDADVAKLVQRLEQVNLSGYSGVGNKNGLTQLAGEVRLPANGVPQISGGKGYQFLEDGPKGGVWMLTVRGDHRLSDVTKGSGEGVPNVRYGVAITGEALQKFFNQHLSDKLRQPLVSGE